MCVSMMPTLLVPNTPYAMRFPPTLACTWWGRGPVKIRLSTSPVAASTTAIAGGEPNSSAT